MTQKLIGNYMTTFSGRKFYPGAPDISMICLEDMARGLSHENRGNGQTTEPLPVGQHSVMIARALMALGYDVRTQMIGLVHDGSEAYIKDIPSPLKELLPDYVEIEKKVQHIVYMWAGLGVVTQEEYEPVHWVDKAMFPVEARAFMPNSSYDIDPLFQAVCIEPWTPEQCREEFTKLFLELQASL